MAAERTSSLVSRINVNGVNLPKLKKITSFQFNEQDTAILQQLRGLESRDHLPDNFVIFDYDSFCKEVDTIDSFYACKFLSENFHVIIVTECDMLKVSFNHVEPENFTVIPAVPSRMLRNVASPRDHIATIIMVRFTEYAKSYGRKAYYCLSADESFPVNTEIIDLIGDEFFYCCVIKSIREFLNLEQLFQKYSDPAKMRLYNLFTNHVPRDDSDHKNCGKVMFFLRGDKYVKKLGPPPWIVVKVQTFWEELKKFADNYDPYPLHVSVTTAFPCKRENCEIVQEYPEITKPKSYRFLIHLPDASEYEVLSVLESLRLQSLIFRSTVWVCKFDEDTKAKKFNSLGYRNITEGRIYKLGDQRILKTDSSSRNTKFQTKKYTYRDLFLDDDHIKQLLFEAKQQGATMKVRHAKIMFCGASGVGKTSFCHLLKNMPLHKERNSTGLGDSQQIMISQKATIMNNEWTELSPADEINQLKLRLKHHKLTEVKDFYTQAPADTLTNPSKVEMVSNSWLQYNNICQEEHAVKISDVKKLPKKVPKKVPEVEKCLTSNFYNVEKQDVDPAEVPEIWDILTLLDTGGQPQFINMLPAVNSSATSTFVVLNMAGGSKILKERIQVHHYRNGVKSHEPYPLNYTNEDLIKCLVALLKDSIVKDVPLPIEMISKEATSHKPGLCFVGTHLDKVTQETIDSITEGLEKLVKDLEPNDNIDIFDLGTLLFAVDNTIAGKDSSPDSFANKIRLKVKKMVEEKAVYEVPIAWILLELEIRQKCIKQKRSFLPFSEVLQMYNSIRSEHHSEADIESEVKAALCFHHMFGVLLYFHDVAGMNEYVISNPQWLFANLTNLVCCSFDDTIVDHSDKKLKSKGILSENLIKRINTDSLGGIDIKHFFQLLCYLKIVIPFPAPDSSDYLMLSILDSFKDENSRLLDSLSPPSSIKLLMQFKSGTIPRGIFCCLVVQLIQAKSKDWKLQSTLNSQRFVFENLVVFCIHSSGHYLVLFDKVTHLEIEMRPFNVGDHDSEVVYYEVQQCITEGLKEVCSCACDDLKYGFYCNKQGCIKPILTLSSKHMIGQESFPQYLQCEKCGLVDMKTHNLWIKSSRKVTGIKEYEVFIDNYSKFRDVLKPGFENMVPYFITERVINPEELIEGNSIRVENFLAKIATQLKDGHNGHLYSLLKIMKHYGKSPDEELALDMEKKLSLI